MESTTPITAPEETTNSAHKPHKKFVLIGVSLVIVLLVVILGLSILSKLTSFSLQPRVPFAQKTAVEKGQVLSNSKCSGEGPVALNYHPINPADIGVIIPYGLVVGQHVTPIDHQYYYVKDLTIKDGYDVHALADSKITGIQYRAHDASSPTKGDYRMVITYTCTFLSYYDLITKLSPEIESKLPAGWEDSSPYQDDINIDIKAGQVIGQVGQQSLDFAIWDTTKSQGFVHETAYNNSESWKNVTVPPLNYFSDSVKQEILPFYVRTVEPRDGIINNDIPGTLQGTWFRQGTNGYIGTFDSSKTSDYYKGHLAIIPDHIDTDSYVLSIGDYKGSAMQFSIKNIQTIPSKVTTETGIIKYELAGLKYVYGDDKQTWTGNTFAHNIKLDLTQPIIATALIQMTGDEELKFEIFPNKTAAQVTSFSSPTEFDRGANAVEINPN